MSVLRVRLFGTVQVDHDDRLTQVKITPKVQALLAYLLLGGPHLHQREMLADLLWQGYTEKQARACLSTTLWRLREALEPQSISPGTYLVTRLPDQIGFNWDSRYWLDVTIFEHQINSVLGKPVHSVQASEVQAVENILNLYIGEPLAGMYYDWALQEKERLNALYLNALEYLARYYFYGQSYDKSLAYSQHILAKEPIHEAIHRVIMRIYLKTGQRALAIRQYEICKHILAKELNILPMEETEALYIQAMQSQSQMSGPAPSDKLNEALNQLGLVAKNLDVAQRQFKLAGQKFEQTQQEFQHVLRLLEQLTKH
jgi:DNA-binding SARP family transcriptional activator